ncbi:hypothetical protein FDH86_gp094 [Arthrobacter phage Tank]|uniref:Uncharacterized protein n=2 Tax=Tankvirus tank TaxID=1982567 RepID=A0A0U4JER8_9CAUD|nr:hypothetical protein FDH86_gp094 [Arthrobacter phage Tank]ALY10629.1 hypothetical protein TANK_94 [Arthrobacter phage Tank]ALY10879.1 hypothetical protein WILDE_97 [Arthrobacter phage Wilde]
MDLNTYSLRIGDKLIVERDGQEHVMEVYMIHPPGTWGTSHAAGPHINCWIRPGGYAVGFDYTHLSSGVVKARRLTEDDCAELIENGSCIHSDCMRRAGK